MGNQPRVLIVDDSHFVRTVLRRTLEEHGLSVVGDATTGAEAITQVHELTPDVVTMDIEMPEMDGLTALKKIMATAPTPVVMLSAHTTADATPTFEALEAGAVDVHPKPGGEVSVELSQHGEELATKIRGAANADPAAYQPEQPTTTADVVGVDQPVTVVVGASTGGPGVIERFLRELPRAADLRVLIVQHMPATFTGRFAERLDRVSEYTVTEARDGQRVGGGEAVVAAGGTHMAVTGYGGGRLRLALKETPTEHGNRPAVDVTMRTAAAVVTDPLVGVVLTGMGKDGTAGLQAIHDAGGCTIAQNCASAVVDSMPQNALATGCVDTTTQPTALAETVIEAISTYD